MPRHDQCQGCGKLVQRTPTSAVAITCRQCRAQRRCGTSAGYSAGCRCQACRNAKNQEMREYHARRRAEGRPVPRSKWVGYEQATCPCCNELFTREKQSDKSKAKLYCSALCRNYHRFGAQSCRLPKDHWTFWIGKTSAWEPRPVGPFPFTCGWCESQSESDYPTTEYCDDTCKAKASRVRRRGRINGAHGTFTWGQVVRLWAMFDQACAYCRRPTELVDIQAEHVIALSRGGANNIGNILPSCMPCNADKRDLTLTEWQADRARRNLAPVITEWDATDQRYAHLAPPAHLAAV